MANLGTIGVTPAVARVAYTTPGAVFQGTKPTAGGTRARRLSTWADSTTYPLLMADLTGTYAGIVTQEGIPVQGHQVLLFWRAPVQKITETISGSNGAFSFSELIPGTNNYFIVILDKAGGTVQNALVLDAITPV